MSSEFHLSESKLKELQDKNLEIAKYFIGFCKLHNIRVYLCGGACLGAVRHKGFIPWDDDIDLFMPAHDFEKLKNIWNDEADTDRYSLCYETRTYNDHHLTPTIRDNNTTFITKETCDTDTNQGVALEVGILNACPKSRIGQKIQLIWAAGASLFKAQRLPNRQSKLIYSLSKILLNIFKGNDIRYFFWSTMEKWATTANKKYDSAEYVREFTMFPFIKWLYPQEWFDEMVWLPFEDTEMPVPKGYKEYLEKRYGDYMTMPPKNDRHPEHRIVFMDLNNSYKKYRGIYYFNKQNNKSKEGK